MMFSVIIPLYNKEAEIGRALRSALAQTLAPRDIVVVDDGSTDGSAAVVERIMAERAVTGGVGSEGSGDASNTGVGSAISKCIQADTRPVIRLIRQPNAGETAARNRGMAEAAGSHFALLDADDEWRPDFLAVIAHLIDDYPAAGLYCTGFDVARGDTLTAGCTPDARGVVADFFGTAMTRFVATASSAAIPRGTVERVGGFPEGMRLGGDQYMWAKIALACPVAFTPRRCVVVHASASNRSAAIYTPESTPYSFRDFADPSRPDVGEFAARVALGKAISATVRGGTAEGRATERDFARNRLSRRLWWRLWVLNRLPAAWRAPVNGLYRHLAWLIARRGF